MVPPAVVGTGRVSLPRRHTRDLSDTIGRIAFGLEGERPRTVLTLRDSPSDRLDDINAAYADVEDAQPDVGGRREARRIVLDVARRAVPTTRQVPKSRLP